MIPQPDLCVVRDAPADCCGSESTRFHEREWSACAARTRFWARTSPNVTVVDAARALPEVVNDVVERMIDRHLAYRV